MTEMRMMLSMHNYVLNGPLVMYAKRVGRDVHHEVSTVTSIVTIV
jgi:hypothetical protein